MTSKIHPRYALAGIALLFLASNACSEADGGGSGGYFGGSGGGFGGAAGASGAYAPPTVDDGSSTVVDDPDPTDPPSTTTPVVTPFVAVGHDPFSTFAADVDTASYDLFEARAEAGEPLPEPNLVRTEEFVNRFEYADPPPAPDAEHPFAVHLEAAQSELHEGRTVLRVAVTGAEAPPPRDVPANLVFLVDSSGSMSSDDKIGLVKRVLRQALEVLDPDDTVAIVTYAGSAGVVLEPTPIAEAATILNAIDDIESGGSTAGSSGITLAYEQARAAYREGGLNHVVLCTDGDFNVGVTDIGALQALIEEERESGVTLTALGFGLWPSGYADSVMETLSNSGNGIYGVIASEEQADAYVAEHLESTLHHIARDLKIQVELNPDYVKAYRLLGYENRDVADEDFRDDLVDGGEIGAGMRTVALYDLVLIDGIVPSPTDAPEVDDGEPVEGEREIGEGELVRVKVRYERPEDPIDAAATELAVALTPDDLGTAWSDASDDFRWSAALATFAQLLREDPFVSSELVGLIHDTVAAQVGLDPERTHFVELFEAVTDQL